MRRDVRTTRLDGQLKVLRRDFPLGSMQRVVVVDGDGRYAGIVLVTEAHQPQWDGTAAEGGGIEPLLRHRESVLDPPMSIKQAMQLFDRTESEALAVVDEDRRVLGLLSEAHVLRRYAEGLETARREIEYAQQYDHRVINDDPDRALAELRLIINRTLGTNE